MHISKEVIEGIHYGEEDLHAGGENGMTEEDKELDSMFLAELERSERSNRNKTQERDKLPKLKIPDELVKGNRHS